LAEQKTFNLRRFKVKRLLVVLGVLSILLCGFGTAHAVFGVVDDVPGTDVVVPIICEKGGTLNTVYAIANVWFAAGATADRVVFDRRSNWVYDDDVSWTEGDVLPQDCQSLVAGMSPMQQTQLETTIGGRTYYVGYVIYFNWNWPDWNQFVSWVYLVDLPKGFASGFNGFQAEGYVTNQLCEWDDANGISWCQTAEALFPRYYIMNNLTETWNWWIVIYGDNDPARILVGYICNEEEDCVSLNIPVPDELNIINVEPYIPAALHPAGYPKAGFAAFSNNESDYDNTVYGFAYQRAEGISLAATWDVIHPIHGVYVPTQW